MKIIENFYRVIITMKTTVLISYVMAKNNMGSVLSFMRMGSASNLIHEYI